MKKIFCVLMILLAIIFVSENKAYAGTLFNDYIVVNECNVTVDIPRSDASLNMKYEFVIEVGRGEFSYFSISLQNSKFDELKALSSNIKSIKRIEGNIVGIYLDRKYNKGEKVYFSFKVHQSGLAISKRIEEVNIKIPFNISQDDFSASSEIRKVKIITLKWNEENTESYGHCYYNTNKGFLNFYNEDIIDTYVKYAPESFKLLADVNIEESDEISIVLLVILIVMGLCIISFFIFTDNISFSEQAVENQPV